MEIPNFPAAGIEEYKGFRSEENLALVVGIFGEDLLRAQQNTDTIMLGYQSSEGVEVSVPALVPAAALEWYNTKLLEEKYGNISKVLCYVHPPVPNQEAYSRLHRSIKEKLDEGYIILTEKYASDDDSPIARLLGDITEDGAYAIETFGDEEESRVDFFVGTVSVNGSSEPVESSSLYDTYQECVKSGEIAQDPLNGASLVGVIEGDEAEEVWRIYDNPFEDLGKDDPTLAGFEKQDLLDILKDPEITKVINRVNGEISTLLIFLQNFDKAPWFNSKYYQDRYPEYYNTGNIFMYPGIVSDENKRGNRYAMDVINLATRIFAKRGSSFLITFECTEISTRYIPSIVEHAINSTGVASVEGLDKPEGVINYYAIRRSSGE